MKSWKSTELLESLVRMSNKCLTWNEQGLSTLEKNWECR